MASVNSPSSNTATKQTADAQSQFKVGNYDYTIISYPESAEYQGGDKVIFFINVTMGGKGISGQTESNTYAIPDTDLVKNSGRSVTARMDKVDASGARMKRLSTAISLYMPNSISGSTSVDWSEEDMSLASTAMAEIANAATSQDAGAGVVSAAKTGASAASVQLLKNAAYQNATRITPGNSKEEMLFKKVSFRDFEFSYVFSPKSPGEAESVLSIIRHFRHHMLPEYKDDANFLFLYPSEFNVKYYTGDLENPYLARHMTAVLTAVSVDYTPNGQWNTVGGGMPQQINMTLRFKELGVPTKESVPYNAVGL